MLTSPCKLCTLSLPSKSFTSSSSSGLLDTLSQIPIYAKAYPDYRFSQTESATVLGNMDVLAYQDFGSEMITPEKYDNALAMGVLMIVSDAIKGIADAWQKACDVLISWTYVHFLSVFLRARAGQLISLVLRPAQQSYRPAR